MSCQTLTMSCPTVEIIDLLDDLDLDIRGFADTDDESYYSYSEPSLLFKLDGAYYPDVDDADYEPLPAVGRLEPDGALGWRHIHDGYPFLGMTVTYDEVIDEGELPTPTSDEDEQRLASALKGLNIQVPPPSPRTASRPGAKENLPSSPTTPTSRAFSRIRSIANLSMIAPPRVGWS